MSISIVQAGGSHQGPLLVRRGEEEVGTVFTFVLESRREGLEPEEEEGKRAEGEPVLYKEALGTQGPSCITGWQVFCWTLGPRLVQVGCEARRGSWW